MVVSAVSVVSAPLTGKLDHEPATSHVDAAACDRIVLLIEVHISIWELKWIKSTRGFNPSADKVMRSNTISPTRNGCKINNHGLMTWAQAPQEILQNQTKNRKQPQAREAGNQLVGTCREVRILTIGQVTWVKNAVSNRFQSPAKVKVGIFQGLEIETP